MHKGVYKEIMDSFESSMSRSSPRAGNRLTKLQLLDEVLHFVIKENIPVRKVESPHLKRLLAGTQLIDILLKASTSIYCVCLFNQFVMEGELNLKSIRIGRIRILIQIQKKITSLILKTRKIKRAFLLVEQRDDVSWYVFSVKI